MFLFVSRFKETRRYPELMGNLAFGLILLLYIFVSLPREGHCAHAQEGDQEKISATAALESSCP
ncbi:hypothetical protein [Lyngbya confervoides]|uniref:Uncharacterized protein n=1 Tax=Lyngbya confervoides BDU141951 TaxID=1574623 RepID=A0ABD4T4F3_9CYAN|nr:hypothetical protein [Lyngbya confervoides]MCM1983308.1 hypothetical protein [Lyngbya confervoides BDU141951]